MVREKKLNPLDPYVQELIATAKRRLDYARKRGNKLQAELREDTLNALLDRLDVTHVIRNPKHQKEWND